MYEPETCTCNHCRHTFPLNQAIPCWGDTLCPTCVDILTSVCDECNERFYSVDDQGDEYHTLCPNCYERFYTHCAHCGSLIRLDDVFYPDDRDIVLCEDCYDELEEENEVIHPYDYKPSPIFHGECFRYFGVELEIDKGGQSNANAQALFDIANCHDENLYIKTDSSLSDGMELVTHPMTLDYHLHKMPWEAILEEARLRGYYSHQTATCGLHIHISRDAFGDSDSEQEPAIGRFIYFVEKFWPEMLRFSRRTATQMERWAARYGAKLNPKDQMKHVKSSYAGRYKAVNLTNYSTIEVRIFRGTLKLNTLLATLQLVNHICDVAIFMSDKQLQDMSWHEFLNDIHEPELIQYLKERRLYVNEPVAVEEDA